MSGNLRNPVGGSVGGYQAPDFRAAIKAGYEGAPKSVWDPNPRGRPFGLSDARQMGRHDRG